MNKKTRTFFLILLTWLGTTLITNIKFPDFQNNKHLNLRKRLISLSIQEKNTSSFKIDFKNIPKSKFFLSRLSENASGQYPNSWFKIGTPIKGTKQIINLKGHKISLALEKKKNSDFNFTAYCYIVGEKTFSSFKIAEMFRWLNFFVLNIKSCWYLKIQGTTKDMGQIRSHLSTGLSVLELPLP